MEGGGLIGDWFLSMSKNSFCVCCVGLQWPVASLSTMQRYDHDIAVYEWLRKKIKLFFERWDTGQWDS